MNCIFVASVQVERDTLRVMMSCWIARPRYSEDNYLFPINCGLKVHAGWRNELSWRGNGPGEFEKGSICVFTYYVIESGNVMDEALDFTVDVLVQTTNDCHCSFQRTCHHVGPSNISSPLNSHGIYHWDTSLLNQFSQVGVNPQRSSRLEKNLQ